MLLPFLGAKEEGERGKFNRMRKGRRRRKEGKRWSVVGRRVGIRGCCRGVWAGTLLGERVLGVAGRGRVRCEQSPMCASGCSVVAAGGEAWWDNHVTTDHRTSGSVVT